MDLESSQYLMEDLTPIDILGINLLPSMDLLRQEKPFIFQQDNAPCHRAKLVKNWFQEQNIEVIAWPANSPDLNSTRY